MGQCGEVFSTWLASRQREINGGPELRCECREWSGAWGCLLCSKLGWAEQVCVGAAMRSCGLRVRCRGKEGRWEEVGLLWSLGRPDWYWPGNNLLWMEILADEPTITQPSSGYLIWLGGLVSLAMTGELPSGGAGYLEHPVSLNRLLPGGYTQGQPSCSRGRLPLAVMAEPSRGPAGGIPSVPWYQLFWILPIAFANIG